MKKLAIVFCLMVVMVVCPAYAQDDVELIKMHYEIGTLANSDNYAAALEKCNAALKLYPNDAELYYWRASIQSSLEKKDLAIKDYDKAISLNPKDSTYYVMRGICKSDIGDSKGAINDYNKAIEVNPNESSAYSMRACEKIKQGDFKGALDDLEKSNSIDGDVEMKKQMDPPKQVNMPNSPSFAKPVKK